MKSLLIAGSLALALVSGAAMAADMPVKARPMLMPPPVMSWTGCYLDAGVGFGLWDQTHHTTTTFGGVPNIDTIDNTGGGDGWLGRFGAGCDYQFSSSWVIGIFGDYDTMSLKGSVSPLTVTTGGAPIVADEKESAAWAVGGRIGYLVAPNVLTYFSGGWTEARFDQINLETNRGVPLNTAFPATTFSGWFLGGGMEYNLTFLPIQGLTVRTEYRFAQYTQADLMEFNVLTGAPAGNGGTGNILHSKTNVQTVTTSLVWRFGWGR